MHTDSLLSVFIWSLCSAYQSSLQARKKTLHLHNPSESQIFFFLWVLISFLLPHTGLVSDILSSKPSPSTSHHSFFQICPSLVERRFVRILLFSHVLGHIVQVSCDEVSELDLAHPLSCFFMQEIGSGVWPVGLQARTGKSFPQNLVQQLREKSRDKFQLGTNLHQQCQRCEMCQYLLRKTAKAYKLWHNFWFGVFIYLISFYEWLVGKKDDTEKLITYKCVTRLHSNLKHSVCIAEKKPDGGVQINPLVI